MEFNNRLYQLRKQKGLSQEELANKLNVSRQTVSKWEVGDSTPDMEKIVAMSDLFEISLDELVMGKCQEEKAVSTSQADVLNVLNKKVLTSNNKRTAKKIFIIAAIILGVIVVVDIVSMIIYFSLHGIPR